LLVTANVVPISLLLYTLMTKPIRSSETLFISRAIRRRIPEDGVLHSHCSINLKSIVVAGVRRQRLALSAGPP
jgi:hypothetical protein